MLPLTENPADQAVAAPAADENTPALEQNAPEFATPAVETVAAVSVPPSPHVEKTYPSLYDTLPTTFGAIVLGAGIIAGIQIIVKKIFDKERMEHKALTRFVTAMFALIVGVWIADKIIAGPTAEIIDPAESKELLTFIKDITLMVFSYYFGTKANVPSDTPESEGGV